LADGLINALNPTHVFKVSPLIPDAEFSKIEYLRAFRKMARSRWTSYGVLTDKLMWRKIDASLVEGDVLTGHCTYGALNLRIPKIRYVTIIRNPMQQFISEFKWLRHGYLKRNALKRFYHKGRLSAATTIDSLLDFMTENAELYKNPSTRYITGRPDHPAPFKHLQENYFCFGLLDETQKFCLDFEKKTGVKVNFPHLNPSPSKSKETLSERNLSLFKKLYETDLDLYARIKDHLLNQ